MAKTMFDIETTIWFQQIYYVRTINIRKYYYYRLLTRSSWLIFYFNSIFYSLYLRLWWLIKNSIRYQLSIFETSVSYKHNKFIVFLFNLIYALLLQPIYMELNAKKNELNTKLFIKYWLIIVELTVGIAVIEQGEIKEFIYKNEKFLLPLDFSDILPVDFLLCVSNCIL